RVRPLLHGAGLWRLGEPAVLHSRASPVPLRDSGRHHPHALARPRSELAVRHRSRGAPGRARDSAPRALDRAGMVQGGGAARGGQRGLRRFAPDALHDLARFWASPAGPRRVCAPGGAGGVGRPLRHRPQPDSRGAARWRPHRLRPVRRAPTPGLHRHLRGPPRPRHHHRRRQLVRVGLPPLLRDGLPAPAPARRRLPAVAWTLCHRFPLSHPAHPPRSARPRRDTVAAVRGPLLPRAGFPAKIRQPRRRSTPVHERSSSVPEQADPQALEALIRSGEIDTVLTVFPDGMGRLMGKRVVGRYFLDHVLEDGVHACIYLFTVDMEMEPLPGFTLTSWERGYGDMKMVPDLSTWRPIPWLPKTALVFCDVFTEEGKPIEEAPRWVLKRQLERARQRGWQVKTASELELYLFHESFDEARAKRYQQLTPVSNYLEDYHILQTSKEEPLARGIRNHMEDARVPVEFSKGEWGKGQEEINLRYAPALEMADRHVLYKHGVKEIAWQQGSSVTFMAKYDMSAAGSSCHIHSSLWDRRTGKALFPARDRAGTPLFQQWLAGQMAMARDFALFYAPTLNSYKRYQAGTLHTP